MPSWLSRKAHGSAKDAPQPSLPAAQCSAEDLGATLEERAQQLSSPQSAAWLLSRWVEQCSGAGTEFETGQGETKTTDVWRLSFFQVLLRSCAFEYIIDTCTKVPALRSALGSGHDLEGGPLGAPLRSLAELVLLPGAMVLWPTLLEALLTGDSGGGPLPWGAWARRLVAALKRPWRSEALADTMRQLDRYLAEVTLAAQAEEASEASVVGAELLQGGQMSKRGIRAALVRQQIAPCGAKAARLRARADVLCEACERLAAAGGADGTGAREVEQLLADADVASASLDTSMEDSSAQHKVIGKTFSDVGSGLQQQITGILHTQDSFKKRKLALLEERDKLLRRIQEVDAEVTELDQESSKCEARLEDLRARFAHSSSHYSGLVDGSLSSRQSVSDQKLRAASFQECARTAVDIAQNDAARRGRDLAAASQRRQLDLAKACAEYVHQERARLGLAAECIAGSGAKVAPGAGGLAEDLAEAVAAAQDAWRRSQAVLQRVDRVMGTAHVPMAELQEAGSAAAAAAEPGEAEACFLGTEAVQEFFSQAAAAGRCFCADCNTAGAEWASVSHGTYLCVDCAGRHRGLGVHVSFVRSVMIDRWSSVQLRRMQLGGNDRFLAFLAEYPGLQMVRPLDSQTALQQRYSCMAAAFYRQRLAAESTNQAFAAAAPPADQGHLPEESTSASRGGAAVDGTAGSLSAVVAILKDERRDLEAAYVKHQHVLQDALAPGAL